jgi:hypothetical protein
MSLLEVRGHHTVESVEKVILDALGGVEAVVNDPAPDRYFTVASPEGGQEP